MPGRLAPSNSTTSTSVRRHSSISSLSHFTLAPSSFPIRLRAVASSRRSEHMLLKISEANGTREIGQACIPLALFLSQPTHPSPRPAPAAASEPEGTQSSRLGAARCDEVIEPALHQEKGGYLGSRPCFPLTSGGALKGWVQLEMRVHFKPLHGPS